MFGEKKKDFDYFAYFRDCSELICEAADYLYASLKDFDAAAFRERMDGIHEIEHRADNIRHDMMGRLMHEFLPPIEREDIAEFASILDDIVDALDDAMRRLYMYNVVKIRSGALSFCELIIRCASALREAVSEFKSFKTSKTIREKLIAVSELESEGDHLHCASLRGLFADEKDPRQLLIWLSLYDRLENCVDDFETAADIMESVIMKNA